MLEVRRGSDQAVRRRHASLVTITIALWAAAGCALVQRPEPTVQAPAQSEPEPYLLLRLEERRLYLVDGKTHAPLDSFRVAVGRPPYETPTGRFQVIEMVENPEFVRFDWNDPSRVFGRIPPGPNNPLGRRWIGFAEAYGWAIGFHGTPKPELLGQAVSHGCVRMHNDDVVRLYDRISLGTTVIVEP